MATHKQKDNKPTHYVRILMGQGKDISFETIGAAWIDDNNIYVKLGGVQIIERGFYILLNNAKTNQESGQ